MNDKVKGLILGITIGSMITGATAFAASGMNIDVVKKKFNIYFDGLEPLRAEGFIYNGKLYLPARTFAEAIENKVILENNDLYLVPSANYDEFTASQLVREKYGYSDSVYCDIEKDPSNRNRYLVRAYEYVIIDQTTGEEEEITLGEYYVDKYTGKITQK
ncbi:hypothetical protein D3C75_241730 [compost metagenome]